MEKIEKTILSQYACSTSLLTIIEAWNQCLDPVGLINNWYSWLWNIDTARGYGLDVWGRIVGATRNLTIPGYGICYGVEESETLSLTDDEFRSVILGAASSNIWDGSTEGAAQTVNRTLPSGGWTIIDDHYDETISLIIGGTSVPAYAQAAIISDVVNIRPAGVGINKITISTGEKIFSFNIEAEYLAGWSEAAWSGAGRGRGGVGGRNRQAGGFAGVGAGSGGCGRGSGRGGEEAISGVGAEGQ